MTTKAYTWIDGQRIATGGQNEATSPAGWRAPDEFDDLPEADAISLTDLAALPEIDEDTFLRRIAGILNRRRRTVREVSRNAGHSSYQGTYAPNPCCPPRSSGRHE